MKKILLINLTLFIILYIILEILTGSLIYSHKLDCHYLRCDRTVIYKNNLTDNKKVIYQRDEYGFRGPQNTLDKIDLLIVGGSTTAQRFINLNDTWPKLIEKKFKEIGKNINVVNAGKGGQSTVGHIWNFSNWFNKIENFKTKYIIFFIGINDIKLKTYKKISTFDHGKQKQKTILGKLHNLLKDNNGVTYKLFILLQNKIYPQNIETFKYKIINQKNYQIIKKKLIFENEQKKYLLNNLEELVRLTRKIKAIPILITQKSLRGNIIDLNTVSIDEFDYYHAELEVAKIIINFCKKNNIFCIDLHQEIKFEYDDFYDLVHTNKKGTKKIANFIFSKLKSNNLNF